MLTHQTESFDFKPPILPLLLHICRQGNKSTRWTWAGATVVGKRNVYQKQRFGYKTVALTQPLRANAAECVFLHRFRPEKGTGLGQVL